MCLVARAHFGQESLELGAGERALADLSNDTTRDVIVAGCGRAAGGTSDCRNRHDNAEQRSARHCISILTEARGRSAPVPARPCLTHVGSVLQERTTGIEPATLSLGS